MTSSAALSGHFYANFQRRAADVQACLASPTEQGRAQASLLLADLRAALTEATVYLPAYDQRRLQQQLQALQSLVASSGNDGPAPLRKPKFSFAKRAAAHALPTVAVGSDGKQSPSFEPGNSAVPPLAPLAAAGPGPTTMRSIAGRRTARLTAPPASDTAETNTDATYSLTLSALGDCVVDLLPLDDGGASMPTALTALYAEDLQRTVMLLPRDLKGSVMLSRLRRCIVVAGCQQFRIHESHDCLILLDIPSHPILERCKGLRFGAYPAGLGGLVGDKASRHAEAQDFDWLRPGQSPNWQRVEGPDLEGLDLADLARQGREAGEPAMQALVRSTLEAAGL